MITWDDITYKQFKLLSDIDQTLSDDEKMIQMMQIIYGESILDLNLKDFSEKAKELRFLNEKMPSGIANRTYKIGGIKYTFNVNPEDITAAQYIDYTNFIKQQNTEGALSVFLIPENSKYNDGSYDLSDVIAGIGDLPCTDVLNMGNFMERFLLAFIMITHHSLIKKIKRDKTMTKKQKTQIIEELERMNYLNLA